MTPAELTAHIHRGLPLTASWGIEVLSAGDGKATLRLPANPDLLRPGPTVSGPALMGLADVAIWVALTAVTEGREDALTSNLSTTFMRPAGAGAVRAEARLVRHGRRSLYAEVWLFSEGAAEPCAHVTSSWTRPAR